MMKEISELVQKYRDLDLHQVKDYDLFNNISIVHHSSIIEGSTLTQTDSELLITEGITPKGKPLEHSLMVKDHYEALLFTLALAGKGGELKVTDVQEINAKVNKSTGSIINTALGSVDVSKGEFRKSNVKAGDHYFVNYDKVVPLTNTLIKELSEQMSNVQSIPEILQLSFDAHFQLVSIHPIIDGNGRTSRLLMNYIQERFKLPLAIVFSEDKADYINALKDSRKLEDIQPFYEFMFEQYRKYLDNEISKAQEIKKKEYLSKNRNRGISFIF
ncbi:Fic family protein [Arachidicoccus soli]|nr:Fic family protein [Arachidicoccus soli]